MDVKQVIVIAVEKNEHRYEFLMPAGRPLGECYDAAFQVLEKLLELSKQNTENMRPADLSSDITGE